MNAEDEGSQFEKRAYACAYPFGGFTLDCSSGSRALVVSFSLETEKRVHSIMFQERTRVCPKEAKKKKQKRDEVNNININMGARNESRVFRQILFGNRARKNRLFVFLFRIIITFRGRIKKKKKTTTQREEETRRHNVGRIVICVGKKNMNRLILPSVDL